MPHHRKKAYNRYMRVLIHFSIILLSLTALCLATSVSAQTADEIDKILAEREYQYMSQANMAKLYWHFGKYSKDDREQVEDFIYLTDCPLYKRYKGDDIQWTEIVNAKQEAIEKEAAQYSTRFEITQKIYLEDYNANTEIFDILDSYDLKKSRTLFLAAADYGQILCTNQMTKYVSDYPEEIVLKTNTPFEFTSFEIEKDIAAKFIEKSQKKFRKLTPERRADPKNKFLVRDVYLVLKFDVFAEDPEGFYSSSSGEKPLYYATLERAELYSDIGRTDLMFVKNYREPRAVDAYEQQLRTEYSKAREQAIGSSSN